MARFTSEQRRTRSERFTTFLKDRGFSWHTASSKFRFIVYDGQELTRVHFAGTGSIYIVGYPGPLKTALLAWSRQEDHRTEDSLLADPFDLQAIQLLHEEYGYLLHPERRLPAPFFPEHIPPDAILLDPSENQLAEVAHLLGYQIYLCAFSPRYLVVSQEQQLVSAGDRLTLTIVGLVRSLV